MMLTCWIIFVNKKARNLREVHSLSMITKGARGRGGVGSL